MKTDMHNKDLALKLEIETEVNSEVNWPITLIRSDAHSDSYQEPMSRSIQLHYISVTAFL